MMGVDTDSGNGERPEVKAPLELEQRHLSQSAETVKLTTEDSIAFAQALLNPPAPNERLRAAAKRYRSFLTGT